jgi:hypothetical protein
MVSSGPKWSEGIHTLSLFMMATLLNKSHICPYLKHSDNITENKLVLQVQASVLCIFLHSAKK